jgi:hypothetical protein
MASVFKGQSEKGVSRPPMHGCMDRPFQIEIISPCTDRIGMDPIPPGRWRNVVDRKECCTVYFIEVRESRISTGRQSGNCHGELANAFHLNRIIGG